MNITHVKQNSTLCPDMFSITVYFWSISCKTVSSSYSIFDPNINETIPAIIFAWRSVISKSRWSPSKVSCKLFISRLGLSQVKKQRVTKWRKIEGRKNRYLKYRIFKSTYSVDECPKDFIVFAGWRRTWLILLFKSLNIFFQSNALW